MEQTTKRSRQRVLFLAFAAFWALGVFEAAQACMVCGNDGSGDGKTAPGLVCQVEVRDKNHNWGYTELGQVCNYDAREEVMVVCPLLRDSWTSTNGLECAAATLVRHGVPSIYGSQYPPATCGLDDVRQWPCILQSKSATGYTGWWTGWKVIGQDGFPPFDFVYDVPTARFMQDWQHSLESSYKVTNEPLQSGIYFLSCILPPVYNCGGSNCLSSLKWIED